MKKLVALVATITLASTSVVACTPKPVSAEPVAEEFLQGMESRNNDGLAALTDAPSDATSALDATYSGLQAEGLDIELEGVDQDENLATANYDIVTQSYRCPYCGGTTSVKGAPPHDSQCTVSGFSS